MFFDKSNGKPVHEKAKMYAAEYAAGDLSRREFLTRATALGVSTAAAYSLIGIGDAKANTWVNPPKKGGTLRCQMEVRPLKDPRTWDWSEIANACGIAQSSFVCNLVIRYQFGFNPNQVLLVF